MEIKPGIYRHYKGGEYQVFSIAHHTETGELFVVYQALYDTPDLGPKPWFVRPYELFINTENVNGEEVPRFVYVRDSRD